MTEVHLSIRVCERVRLRVGWAAVLTLSGGAPMVIVIVMVRVKVRLQSQGLAEVHLWLWLGVG